MQGKKYKLCRSRKIEKNKWSGRQSNTKDSWRVDTSAGPVALLPTHACMGQTADGAAVGSTGARIPLARSGHGERKHLRSRVAA